MRLINNIITLIKGQKYKLTANLKSWDKLPAIIEKKNEPRVIVSLTSYGRRVEKVVCYTLFSLYNQTQLPDKIILWLDYDHWTNENLPERLKMLEKKGLVINFCKDIKSFKKLLPSLKQYPEDIIITVDDDVIYPIFFIEQMYKSYLKSPEKIHAGSAREVKILNNKFLPYNSWLSATKNSKYISPIGFGGVLYPPNSLSKEVFKEEIFMEICPDADDMWFFIMGLLKHTKYQLVDIDRSEYFGVDTWYQHFHKGAALANNNVKNGGNNEQLKKCVAHYNICPSEYFP